MKSILIHPKELGRTFTLIARHDTHYFIEHDLPEFLSSLSDTRIIRFRNYFSRLRSGEYIPKAAYSDTETTYVYLTIGQFSGKEVSLKDLTFLDESIGKDYGQIKMNSGDLVITRSETVGTVHKFIAPHDKIYIPSHHLAIVQVPEDGKHSVEFLRLFLQGEFARKYFWSFATGKGQKEISNWSIKSIPIPQCDDPHRVADECITLEQEIARLETLLMEKQKQKERVLYDAIRSESE